MFAKQKGLGLSNLIFGSVILVVLGIVGMKLVPAYMQNKAVQQIFWALADDPKLKKAKHADISLAYYKRAGVDNITAVTEENMKIDVDDAGKLVISAKYDVRVRLGGNLYILMDFNPTSAAPRE